MERKWSTKSQEQNVVAMFVSVHVKLAQQQFCVPRLLARPCFTIWYDVTRRVLTICNVKK